jgi:hypothetical protein
MRKSDLLRVQDVRDAYRLIGECRDLGSDPAPWQLRMFGLRSLGNAVNRPASVTGPESRLASSSTLRFSGGKRNVSRWAVSL